MSDPATSAQPAAGQAQPAARAAPASAPASDGGDTRFRRLLIAPVSADPSATDPDRQSGQPAPETPPHAAGYASSRATPGPGAPQVTDTSLPRTMLQPEQAAGAYPDHTPSRPDAAAASDMAQPRQARPATDTRMSAGGTESGDGAPRAPRHRPGPAAATAGPITDGTAANGTGGPRAERPHAPMPGPTPGIIDAPGGRGHRGSALPLPAARPPDTSAQTAHSTDTPETGRQLRATPRVTTTRHAGAQLHPAEEPGKARNPGAAGRGEVEGQARAPDSSPTRGNQGATARSAHMVAAEGHRARPAGGPDTVARGNLSNAAPSLGGAMPPNASGHSSAPAHAPVQMQAAQSPGETTGTSRTGRGEAEGRASAPDGSPVRGNQGVTASPAAPSQTRHVRIASDTPQGASPSPRPDTATRRQMAGASIRDRRHPRTEASGHSQGSTSGGGPKPARPDAWPITMPGQDLIPQPHRIAASRADAAAEPRSRASREEGPMPVEMRAGDAGQPRLEAMPAAAQRIDAGRPASVQIVAAAAHLGDRPVEITLSPEELGRVRLTLSGSTETGLTVHVQAERAETMDLLRRHANELAEQLMKLGYASVAFGFAGQDNRDPDDRHPGSPATAQAADPRDTPAPPDQSATTASEGDTGLDLRL